MGCCCQTSATNIHTIDPSGPCLVHESPGTEHLGVIGSGIYGIGRGTSGQFGLGHTLDLQNLVPILSDISSGTQVSNILCACHHAVYIINNVTSSNRNINDKETIAKDEIDENINISNNIYVAGIVNGKHDHGFYQIRYFVENNIIIKRVCVNVMSSCIFFITDKNQVYGCAKNDSGKLGISNKIDTADTSLISPVLIEYFSHLQTKIIDIQSNNCYSLALTTSNNPKYITRIVNYWTTSSTNNIDIPKDLINIIGKYCNIGNQVHSSNGLFVTSQEEAYDKMIPKWRKRDFFDGKNIVSLTLGSTSSFLLESSGKVWMNDLYQSYPTVVEYFVENDIKIVDIKSGVAHMLAIDSNYNVYSWGNNSIGQCGQGVDASSFVSTPKLIVDLAEYKIVNIDCGENHSYCCSQDGKHWMFGANWQNECVVNAIDIQTSGDQVSVTNQDQMPWIESPYCIDDKGRIKCLSLGYEFTIMILDL